MLTACVYRGSVIAIQLSWDSFNGQLPDGDIINVSIDNDVAPPNTVEFRLEAADGITSWKGLLVPDGLRSSWVIHTEDSRTVDSVSLWAEQVHNGQELEFSKPGFLGFPTGIYTLGGLDRLPPGSCVTFQWAQDEAPQLAARVAGFEISLTGLDDSFAAYAGQTFHATVTIWNLTENPPWSSDRRYKLGSWNPADNATWGPSRIELPGEITCLERVDFLIAARAPSVPGRYPFSWRMVQEGVTWFGDALDYDVQVSPAPPSTGEIDISLAAGSGASATYTAASPDPSVTQAYQTPRHAMIESVRNAAEDVFYLAHRDRLARETSYIHVPAHGVVTAPFAGLEVEGEWRAVYQGPGPAPPQTLNVSVNWDVP